MMSSSLSKKVCFNSNCKEASEKWRNGWRRRTGEYAHLCDRCASAYEEGKFCEAFHSSTSGWRCCESCEKQIHCGCIVSFHLFVLLDAGGIECLTCARKSVILTPNPAWPPLSRFLPSQFERRKDFSVKTSGSIVGSGPVPWKIAPSLFKESNVQSDAQTRMPFEIDVVGGINLFGTSERLPAASPEKKQEFPDEKCFNGKLRVGPFDTFQNGHTALNPKEHPFLSINNIQPTIIPKDDSSNFSLTTVSSSKTELDDACQLSTTFSTQHTLSIPVGKHVGSHYRMDSCGETQVRNGKVQVDGWSRNQLLTRFRPQITEEELLKISSNSKSVITPLFEKTLSASDAGRIGRLVLGKKCAEACFPPISQPEGLPLKVLDVKGKEWVFQFRFWPNNNSRMYVLEGITPCIQSLRLQAGDVVTFSRLEPEGKLVMGGRKSSSVPSPDQGDGAVMKGNKALIPENCQAKNKCVEGITVNGHMKGKSPSSFQPISHVSKADIGSSTSEIHETKPLCSSKGQGSILVSKCKRLRIENDIELMLSTDEAQGLMRPPAKIVPSVFVVGGCEFEEFEGTAPVIGRPTIPATDPLDEKIQWVQCEDCFKWRKVPEDALLPSGWICSENVWDLDRSRCSDAEELAVEKLEDILPAIDKEPEPNVQIAELESEIAVNIPDTVLDTFLVAESVVSVQPVLTEVSVLVQPVVITIEEETAEVAEDIDTMRAEPSSALTLFKGKGPQAPHSPTIDFEIPETTQLDEILQSLSQLSYVLNRIKTDQQLTLEVVDEIKNKSVKTLDKLSSQVGTVLQNYVSQAQMFSATDGINQKIDNVHTRLFQKIEQVEAHVTAKIDSVATDITAMNIFVMTPHSPCNT